MCIEIDDKWVAKKDNELTIVVIDLNKTHVLIEVVGSKTISRGCLTPKPHRDMLSRKRFIDTFKLAETSDVKGNNL